MRLGNHGPGSPSRRRNGAFRPDSEPLEGRLLLSTIDLAQTQFNTTPPPSSYGVQMIGTTGSGAGYTVTDVGDATKIFGGYDDYVIGAPGLTTPSINGQPAFTGTSTAYLVIGSDSVGTSTAVPYNTLASLPLTQGNQRAGDLGQLGKFGELTNPAYQINPTVTQPIAPAVPFVGYNYNGLTFTTSQTANSGLGYSIAALGDIDGSGYNSFAIGAPNAAGGGKVYIIYGSTALAALAQQNTAANKIIDLDLTNNTNALVAAGVKEVILTDSSIGPGAQFGYSVAGLGNYFNYGPSALKDIAIGAPGATDPTSGVANEGAAYAISGLRLQGVASGSVVDLATQLVSNTLGIKYLGLVGSRAGASVAAGLNFAHDLTTAGSFEIDDLVIGAPGIATSNFQSGRAYLVYGEQQFANTNNVKASMLGTVQNLNQIGGPLPVNSNLNYPLEGVIFQNPGVGSTLFGFSASTAGDYNGDGLNDVIIGAPGGQGTATIFYGIPQIPAQSTPTVPTPATHFVGLYPINGSSGTPVISTPLTYQGQATVTGDDAGFSVSYIGDIPGQGINGVLIGAPLTNGGLGQAYMIPGNYQTPTTPPTNNFLPTVSLTTATATNSPYAGVAFTASNSFTATTSNQPYLGTSVSGRTPLIPVSGNNSQQFSLDADTIPDVFVGAPGFNLSDPATNNTTLARMNAGTVFALEGSLLPNTPPNDVAVTAAGIGTNSPTGPYTISPTAALTIYIFSATTPQPLDPVLDIATPATLIINGVTFTNIVITPSPSATDAGEVKFTLTTADVAKLNLVASTTPISFLIRGTTQAPATTSVFIARALNDVTVTGGGGAAAGGSAIAGASAAQILAIPYFTGDLSGQPFPTVASLSRLSSYQPLPVPIAYEQFLAKPGFLAREEVSNRKGKAKNAHQAPAGTNLVVAAIAHSAEPVLRVHTLSSKVFTRGKFKVGRETTFTHKVRVIPASQQTQSFPG